MQTWLSQIQFKNNETSALKKQKHKEEVPAQATARETISTIAEAEHEEQGSSGTNPLSKNMEYEADLDQTQISMNSKEESKVEDKQQKKPEEAKVQPAA